MSGCTSETPSQSSVSATGPPVQAGNWITLRNVNEVHVELTSTCNLSCSYCYAEVERPGRGFPLFSIETYRRTIQIIAGHSGKPHIQIIFHGGEPLLQSAEWYDQACGEARSMLACAGKTCEFGLQSNLTLLRENHVDVFVKHRVSIGTSIDGPQAVHDAVRGKFQATVRNVHRLMEAGVFSGAIAVLHHHNWELVREIYATFVDIGIRAFHLNVASAVGHGAGAIPLSEDQIYRILCDDFDEMRDYDGEIVETRLLDKLRRYVARPTAGEFLSQLKCDNPFCHAGINMVVVKHTGEIFPCGCAGSSGNIQRYLLGNVLAPAVDPAFYGDQLRRFHAKTEKYERECRMCPARFVCEHGCPAFDINDPVTPEHHCGATKRFNRYLDCQPPDVVRRIGAFEPQPFVLRLEP